MKLLGRTESKITGEKNGENVPHLEIVELVLVHCNIFNNNYQQKSRILYTRFFYKKNIFLPEPQFS